MGRLFLRVGNTSKPSSPRNKPREREMGVLLGFGDWEDDDTEDFGFKKHL